MDDIQVTIRTGTTGHQTHALSLGELPAFIDRHRTEGKLAVATSGDASVVVRIGREVLDFFRGRRKTADEAGRPREKEEVTVLNPLAGGADVPGEEAQAPTMAAVLSAAATARLGQRNQELSVPIAPPGYRDGRGGGAPPMDAVAEMRAWRGLQAQEGEAAVAPFLHGGGVAVRSASWPAVVYLVKADIVLVLREGQIVQRLCLQSADGAPLWDAVANRLQLLRSGVEGELAVWAAAGIS